MTGHWPIGPSWIGLLFLTTREAYIFSKFFRQSFNVTILCTFSVAVNERNAHCIKPSLIHIDGFSIWEGSSTADPPPPKKVLRNKPGESARWSTAKYPLYFSWKKAKHVSSTDGGIPRNIWIYQRPYIKTTYWTIQSYIGLYEYSSYEHVCGPSKNQHLVNFFRKSAPKRPQKCSSLQ